jgi:hypothetical protein
MLVLRLTLNSCIFYPVLCIFSWKPNEQIDVLTFSIQFCRFIYNFDVFKTFLYIILTIDQRLQGGVVVPPPPNQEAGWLWTMRTGTLPQASPSRTHCPQPPLGMWVCGFVENSPKKVINNTKLSKGSFPQAPQAPQALLLLLQKHRL